MACGVVVHVPPVWRLPVGGRRDDPRAQPRYPEPSRVEIREGRGLGLLNVPGEGCPKPMRGRTEDEMPKAILEFDLNKEEQEHRDAVNGGKYREALADIDSELRAKEKYHPDESGSWTDARDILRKVLEEAGLRLHD